MVDYNSAYTGAQIDANLAKAATAVQPAGLATVATTGAYNDLTGKPTLGTAAAAATGDFATAAQGTLAASAVQPGANANVLGSGTATDNFVLTANGSGGVAWEAAAGGSSVTDYLRTRLGTVQDVFNMADTWNASGTTFTGIKLNVTDTASAAGSLLMDLQVGGVSQFKVSKTGAVTTPGSLNAGVDIYWTRDLYALSGTSRITWSGNLSLHQDAANTLAQRNGVNAQAFNLYNTYTDASNYERGFMRFVSNALQIGSEKLGTGTARALELRTDGVARFTASETGIVTIDATEFNANINTIRFISAETTGQDTMTFGSVSTDIDFAFKGSSNVNLILTDGGTNALGFFGATPAARPTTAIAAATFAANTSGIADDTATFGGYTMGQVVQALRNLGFLT